MGLIRGIINLGSNLTGAVKGAGGSVLQDQWKEFFYCDAIANDVLAVKGKKRITDRSVNTHASDNIISNGSGIAVADGQCMIIVEQGKIVEICAEPGEFTYDQSTEPSIFTGKLGSGILNSFKTAARRFTYGGDTAKDQRVYYFNTKEILDNLFGTPAPIPFRVVDKNIGLDIDISVRCNGVYTYRLQDPILFYTNVCGNVQQDYRKNQLEATMKAELLKYLGPAFAKISEKGVRPNQLVAHNTEICDALKEELTGEWLGKRGIQIETISFNSITIPKEDEELIKQAQKTGMLQNATYAAATLASAQAEALKAAAGNENGAMMGFMGMGLAQQAGGLNAQQLYQVGAQQEQARSEAEARAQEAARQEEAEQRKNAVWKCSCGTENVGNFCSECGSPKPAAANGWTCACGTVNKGKFCTNCGAKKPAGAPLYRCDKCGWEPEDPMNPPKFCPECGDRFDENDIKN